MVNLSGARIVDITSITKFQRLANFTVLRANWIKHIKLYIPLCVKFFLLYYTIELVILTHYTCIIHSHRKFSKGTWHCNNKLLYLKNRGYWVPLRQLEVKGNKIHVIRVQ